MQAAARRLSEALRADGRVVLGGVEWLSSMQGIAIKLMAYEALLESYPKYRQAVTLLQVGVPVGARASDVGADVAGACREIALRIRQRFGGACLHYIEVGHAGGPGQPPTAALELSAAEWCVSTRVAVWTLLDVLLVTATRDGLNLLPFEYVCARRLQGVGGVCVLSEFAGCSRVLNGAIRVNPFSLSSVVEAVDRALSLDKRDAQARMGKDWAFLDAHTTSSWVQLFVKDLKRVRTPRETTRAARRTRQKAAALRAVHHPQPRRCPPPEPIRRRRASRRTSATRACSAARTLRPPACRARPACSRGLRSRASSRSSRSCARIERPAGASSASGSTARSSRRWGATRARAPRRAGACGLAQRLGSLCARRP